MDWTNWKVRLFMKLKFVSFVFACFGWFILFVAVAGPLLGDKFLLFIQSNSFVWILRIFIVGFLLLLIFGHDLVDKWMKIKIVKRIVKIIYIGGIVGWVLGIGSLVVINL